MLVFCDGFDNYAASADLTKKWASAGTGWAWSPGAGRFGGGAITNAGGGSGNAIVSQQVTTTLGQTGFGFYFKASAKPGSTQTLVFLKTSSLLINSGIAIDTNGFIQMLDNDASPRTASAINVCDNQWHWIEFRSNVGDGSCPLSIDNIAQPLQRFGGSPAAYVTFYSISGITVTIDDVVLYDTTAGAPLANIAYPFNSLQITSKSVASDGTCSFATLSSGVSHNALLSETNPDGDGSYVEDGTSGNQDLLGVAALGYTPSSIKAVMLNVYMKVGGSGGSINNQLLCKSVAATSTSASAATTATYATRQVGFGVDPNTSAAWTASGLNSAQFGYKNP